LGLSIIKNKMANMIKMHLGKKGLTPEFIEDIKVRFKQAESVRIGLLKSSTRDREEIKQWADKIKSELGEKYTYKIIGFTIVVRKWRKARNKT